MKFTIDITNADYNNLMRDIFDLGAILRKTSNTINNCKKEHVVVRVSRDNVVAVHEYIVKHNWSYTADFYILASSYGLFLVSEFGKLVGAIDGDLEEFKADHSDEIVYDVKECSVFYKGGNWFDVNFINYWNKEGEYITAYDTRTMVYTDGGAEKDYFYQLYKDAGLV